MPGMFDDILSDSAPAPKAAPAGGMFDDIIGPQATPKPTPQPETGLSSYLPKAISDIPHEIYDAGATAAHGINEGLNPLAHKGEPLAGAWDQFKRVGSGLASIPEAVAAPVTGFARSVIGHPYADITGIPYDKAKNAVDLAMAGMRPKGFSPRGALPQPAPAAAPAPTIDELHAAADASFKAVRGFGVEIKPAPVARLADDIFSELHNDGFRERNVPKTWSAIDELKSPTGANVTVDDLWSVRKALNKAAANPTEGAEREASRRAISSIDDYLSRLDPAHVAVNAHFAPRVAGELKNGIQNYAAAKRAETLAEKELLAGDSAGSSGSGANLNNALRQKMRAVLASPAQRRGFSPDELEQMRRVVRGTKTGNITRMVGKLAPTGVVSALPSLLAAAASGLHPGALAIPAVGFTAKKLGEMSTARQMRVLDAAVRSRSPLARASSPALAPPSVTPARPYPYLYGASASPLAALSSPYGAGANPYQP